jgi:Tfp pilus assembly protein PilX
MSKPREKGIALIITLILVLVMSVMAISLMFVSQTETWSSFNYRLASQARDGAEAGINSAANYIVNTYTQPGGTGDPTTAYINTVSPVTYGGNTVILSAMSGTNSVYPVSSVKSAFNTNGAGKGSITVGNTTVNYATTATLLSMHSAFKPLGDPSTNVTVQTWKIVSDGTIGGVRSAKVEESTILEQHIIPTFNYAVFGSSPTCGALTFGGGGTTNSYDSSTYSGSGTPTFSASGGDVGTNGNLTTNGSASTRINGDLFTPKAGVGSCSSSNVDAYTQIGQSNINGTVVQLPQAITYPPPKIPAPGTLNISLSGATCPTGLSAIPGCQVSGNNLYLPPGSYHDISISGQVNLQLSPGIYNINTFSMAGNNAGVVIYSSPCNSPCDSTASFDPTPGTGPIIMNVAGLDSSGNPVSAGTDVITFTGNSVQNPSLVPFNFQVQYAGVGNIKLAGNSQAAAVVYAPQASYAFNGNNTAWYGAVVGNSMSDMGGVNIHYDRHLQNRSYIVGPWLVDSFTWKKD